MQGGQLHKHKNIRNIKYRNMKYKKTTQARKKTVISCIGALRAQLWQTHIFASTYDASMRGLYIFFSFFEKIPGI